MHSYKFEDKKDDADFLAGRPVICKAFFKEVEPTLASGDTVLVVLSSGKKRVNKGYTIVQHKRYFGC